MSYQILYKTLFISGCRIAKYRLESVVCGQFGIIVHSLQPHERCQKSWIEERPQNN